MNRVVVIAGEPRSLATIRAHFLLSLRLAGYEVHAVAPIRYHGPVEDVRQLIAAARIYVLPSYREGTSRSVLEAMAMGRPVITTDAPGCRAPIVPGLNGLLVPVGDTVALAEAMIRLIDNPDEAKSMAEHSRSIAEQRYDVRHVTAHVMKILEA